MENFKTLYRESLCQYEEEKKLSIGDKKIGDKIFRKLIDVDFNNKYDDLYWTIMGRCFEKPIQLYSSIGLKSALQLLTPREKYVIERRFILDNEKFPTDYAIIARELEISIGRVRNLECKALRKLRTTEKVRLFRYTGILSEKKQGSSDNTSEWLTDEEERLCSELLDNIYSSDIIYSNSSYEILQEDENRDILKGIKFIKNRSKIIHERKMQAEKEELFTQVYPDALNVTIVELDLSTRAFNCLIKANITTLEQLSQLSIEELTKIRNLGRKSMEEILEKLKEYGITLKENCKLSQNSDSVVAHEQTDVQSAEDKFAEDVVLLATRKVAVRNQEQRASELEEQYTEELPKNPHTFDEE